MNLNYIKVLDHEGYSGYVCTPEAYGSEYFGKRLTECVYIRDCTTRGRDFAHFNDSFEKHPLVDNVENGTYLLCKLMCDKNDPGFFTFDQPLENGSNITRRLAYEYVKLSIKIIARMINNGSYVSYEISNLDLISPESIEIVMTNENVYTDNLTFYKNILRFKVQSKEDMNNSRYEETSGSIKYGIAGYPTNMFKFCHIIVMKEENSNCSSMRDSLHAIRNDLMKFRIKRKNERINIKRLNKFTNDALNDYKLQNKSQGVQYRSDPRLKKITDQLDIISTKVTDLEGKLIKMQTKLKLEKENVRDLKKKLNVSNEKTYNLKLKLKDTQEKSLEPQKMKSTKSLPTSKNIINNILTVPCVILVISILLNIFLGYQMKRKSKIERNVQRENEDIVENVLH